MRGRLVTVLDWRLSSQMVYFPRPIPLTTFRNGILYLESESGCAMGAGVGEECRGDVSAVCVLTGYPVRESRPRPG